MKKLDTFFSWLDANKKTKSGKTIYQAVPIIVCAFLFVFFVLTTKIFMDKVINPSIAVPIVLKLSLRDVAVGFFLYFVTAIDYALIVGRMQTSNPGSKARLVMNILTCVGCYIGVTMVLFLWGFAKDITVLIVPILIFAGSVMIKLAYEGTEYFEESKQIPKFFRIGTKKALEIMYYPTRIFTFWMPELGKPTVKKMKLWDLAKWSFLLPFLIGLDDLIGYMGAMTIYNAFGLIFGIYIADILIDLLIFISPDFTKKIVESPLLSILAAYAFIYLAYKSYSESFMMLHEQFHITSIEAIGGIIVFVLGVVLVDWIVGRITKRHYIQDTKGKRD